HYIPNKSGKYILDKVYIDNIDYVLSSASTINVKDVIVEDITTSNTIIYGLNTETTIFVKLNEKVKYTSLRGEITNGNISKKFTLDKKDEKVFTSLINVDLMPEGRYDIIITENNRILDKVKDFKITIEPLLAMRVKILRKAEHTIEILFRINGHIKSGTMTGRLVGPKVIDSLKFVNVTDYIFLSDLIYLKQLDKGSYNIHLYYDNKEMNIIEPPVLIV